MVSLKSSPWIKYTQYGAVFQKNIMFYYQTFFLLQICSLLDCSSQIPEEKKKKIRGSPCSFERNGAFISLSGLICAKSLTFCMRTCSCARANDAKIVRSRDAQCNTKELP